jgi:hypothetical protein
MGSGITVVGGCKKKKKKKAVRVEHQSSSTKWDEGRWAFGGYKRIKPGPGNDMISFEGVRNGNVHICAKAPEDPFTVRPKVDKARKEPSKIKWMSASNV